MYKVWFLSLMGINIHGLSTAKTIRPNPQTFPLSFTTHRDTYSWDNLNSPTQFIYRHKHTFTNNYIDNLTQKYAKIIHTNTDTNAHTNTHTHTHTHTHKHTHTNTYTNMHNHSNTHILTNTHTYKHTNTHIHKNTHTHTQTHTYTYTQTQTNTHTHTDTHTHTHTWLIRKSYVKILLNKFFRFFRLLQNLFLQNACRLKMSWNQRP